MTRAPPGACREHAGEGNKKQNAVSRAGCRALRTALQCSPEHSIYSSTLFVQRRSTPSRRESWGLESVGRCPHLESWCSRNSRHRRTRMLKPRSVASVSSRRSCSRGTLLAVLLISLSPFGRLECLDLQGSPCQFGGPRLRGANPARPPAPRTPGKAQMWPRASEGTKRSPV